MALKFGKFSNTLNLLARLSLHCKVSIFVLGHLFFCHLSNYFFSLAKSERFGLKPNYRKPSQLNKHKDTHKSHLFEIMEFQKDVLDLEIRNLGKWLVQLGKYTSVLACKFGHSTKRHCCFVTLLPHQNIHNIIAKPVMKPNCSQPFCSFKGLG